MIVETHKGSMQRPRRVHSGRGPVAAAAAAAVVLFFGMFIYELCKELWAPDLTKWQSHLLTMVVTAALSAAAAYFASVRRGRIMRSVIESEQRYRTIIRTAMDGFMLLDAEGVLLEVNERYCAMSGYSEHELIGKRVADIEAQETGAVTADHLRRIMAQGEDRFESRHRRKDGTVFDIEASVRYRDVDGGRLLAFLRDISERKQAETALANSEARFMQAFYASNDAILLIDDARFIECNQATLKMLDCSQPELLLLHPAELSPPAQPDGRSSFEKIEEMMRLAYQNGFQRFEWVLCKASGEELPVEISLTPMTYQGRGVLHCLWRDITDVWRMAEALRASESRMRAITDSAQDAILMMDARGDISYWNPAAERVLGYSSSEALGRNVHAFIVPSRYQPAHRAAFPHFQRTGEGAAIGKTLELHALRKDGVEITVALSLSALQIHEEWHAVGIMRDITAQKQAEMELVAAKKAAEESVRAKSEFLANMSHEIRTPMNGVIGMADLLEATELTDEQRNLLSTIRSSGELLLGIVNDVLDYSKIEAGKVLVSNLAFDVRRLVDTLGELLQPRLVECDLVWVAEVDPRIARLLVGDSLRVQQVLVNLLSNAIKFTPHPGAVVLQVLLRSRSEHGAVVGFYVSDTGIGVPPEKREMIFESFAQVDSSVTRKYGGTGLGLTISAKLVKLLGGDLKVQSAPGIGSVFYFECPFQEKDAIEESPQAVTQVPSRPARPQRILVAEDNLVNQKVIVRLLESAGHSVTIAADGNEAVERYRCGEFDLILMDIQMPRKGGVEAAAEIRGIQVEPGCRKIPILALTAHALEGDREKYLGMGMDGYISKPINRAEVLKMIAEFAAA